MTTETNSCQAFFPKVISGTTGLWVILVFLTGCFKEKETVNISGPTPFQPDIPPYLQSYYKVPSNNPTTLEGIALGKVLFFEKALSQDFTISCATCHQPENGLGDGMPLALGIGNQKGRRQSMNLWNVSLQNRFFWDGRDTSLEQQSLHPIQDPKEMGMNLSDAVARIQSIPRYPSLFMAAFGNAEINSEKIARALAQFERSLLAFNTKYDRYLKGLYTPNAEEAKGMQLFFQHPEPFAGLNGIRGGNCGDCHAPQTLMGRQDGFGGFHNTGLSAAGAADRGLQEVTGQPADFGKFKTPPLRNVALTAPYMHDGRFQTLEEVLNHYNSDTLFNKSNVDGLILLATNQKFGQSLMLREDEKKAILAFLHMLTDSTATFDR